MEFPRRPALNLEPIEDRLLPSFPMPPAPGPGPDHRAAIGPDDGPAAPDHGFFPASGGAAPGSRPDPGAASSADRALPPRADGAGRAESAPAAKGGEGSETGPQADVPPQPDPADVMVFARVPDRSGEFPLAREARALAELARQAAQLAAPAAVHAQAPPASISPPTAAPGSPATAGQAVAASPKEMAVGVPPALPPESQPEADPGHWTAAVAPVGSDPAPREEAPAPAEVRSAGQPDPTVTPVDGAAIVEGIVLAGVPVAGVLPFDADALREEAQGLADRIAELAVELPESPTGPERYLWFAAAALVAGGAGYAARAQRARQDRDRVTLGTDSVRQRWEERDAGGA